MTRWAEHNERHRAGPWPDRNAEYLLYQTLVGAWPLDAERAVRLMEKATREAKVHTSWTDPVAAYDEAVAAFVRGVLGDDGFVADLEAFLAEHQVMAHGRVNVAGADDAPPHLPRRPRHLPGQRAWDLSLVDPDNRRPVDFERRRRLLDELAGAGAAEALRHMDDGGAKLWLTHRVLDHRRRHPGLYVSGAYAPLPVQGRKAPHAVAFSRGDLAVVVLRLVARLAGDWDDATVSLPAGRWVDAVSGASHDGDTRKLSELLGAFPVAVLAREAV